MKAYLRVLTVVLAIALVICAAATYRARLSNLSEQECLEFVKNAGIEIPSDDEAKWASFAKRMILYIEEGNDVSHSFSYDVTQEFADEIQNVVIAYYHTDFFARFGTLLCIILSAAFLVSGSAAVVFTVVSRESKPQTAA